MLTYIGSFITDEQTKNQKEIKYVKDNYGNLHSFDDKKEFNIKFRKFF